MPSKKVQNVLIDLNIKGAEKLGGLKSAFRDLGKTLNQTDADIDAARQSVFDYVKTSNQSEGVIKGQIKAFEALREQAKRGGDVYQSLSNDISRLKAELTGLGSGVAINSQKSLTAQIGRLQAEMSELNVETVEGLGCVCTKCKAGN